jgi:hypothetical protein
MSLAQRISSFVARQMQAEQDEGAVTLMFGGE